LNQKDDDKKKTLKEKLISDFMFKIDRVQKSFLEVSKQKHNDYVSKLKQEMSVFNKALETKNTNIKKSEEEIAEYYKNVSLSKDYVPLNVLREHHEYVRLENEEKELINKQKDLEAKLMVAQKNYFDKKNDAEKTLKNLVKDYKLKLQQYELEETWLKEEISSFNPGIINSVFSDSDTCSLCKNSNVVTKKYYCQDCRKRYCAGTCAKLCSTSNCSKMNKYICPECVQKCGLCRKNIFCGDCKKPCYYTECKLIFCPECYKKNAHQARAPNNNCAFFTCEVDKTKACLMSSLFCVKCEKRLCNNCLFNDVDHFKTLFN